MSDTDIQKRPRRQREIEVIEDDSFDYDGYEVVRGEFFAHTYEPTICFFQTLFSKK